MIARVRALSLLTLLALSPAIGAEEFSFDASEFEKKTFEFSGYFEQKLEGLNLRGDSAAFRLAFPDEAPRSNLLRSTSTLEASGKLNLDPFVADVRVQASHARDALEHSSTTPKVMEGGLRWSAGPGLTFDVGKRVQRWGKGYAWNPVGFVERPKDPTDPQASREGFTMASGEWTKSLSGALTTISLSGLIVPTKDAMNADFGQNRHLNPAAKLYLLAWDTDIDLMWRGKGAKPQSFGFDFSRNISSALEVHGEWARTLDVSKNLVSTGGVISKTQLNVNSWLLGARYITEGEVTWIAEYYRNGMGYGVDQIDDYYQFLETALAPGASPALVGKARNVAQSGYGRANPGRDYLYLKASVSEPFDWLYGAASVTAMTNLHDGSFQITPEVSYTGFNNVELRARLMVLNGLSRSEFGEKTVDRRVEISARFYF